MRRRVVLGAFVGATLLVGSTVAAVVVGSEESTPSALRTSYADAATVREGDDFRVLERLPATPAARADLMLHDGRLVLLGGRDLTLVDPATGERRDIERVKPRHYSARVALLADGDLWLSWSGYTGGRVNDPDNRSLQGVRVDPETGERQEVSAPDRVARPDYPAPVAGLVPGVDGRLYFLTGKQFVGDGEGGTAARTVELWSTDPADPSDARREARSVVDVVMAGEHVIWTEASGFVREDDGYRSSTATVVHSRDLRDGSEQRVRLEDCRSDPFGDVAPVSTTLVPIDCGTDDGTVDLVVLSAGGVMLARIATGSDGYPLLGAGVGERFVVRGSHAYDAERNRVVRLTSRRGWVGPRDSVPARVATAGDHILFPHGDSPRSAQRGSWVYAEMLRDG